MNKYTLVEDYKSVIEYKENEKMEFIEILNNNALLILQGKNSENAEPESGEFDFNELEETLSELGMEFCWNCLFQKCCSSQIDITLKINGEAWITIAEDEHVKFILQIISEDFFEDLQGFKQKRNAFICDWLTKNTLLMLTITTSIKLPKGKASASKYFKENLKGTQFSMVEQPSLSEPGVNSYQITDKSSDTFDYKNVDLLWKCLGFEDDCRDLFSDSSVRDLLDRRIPAVVYLDYDEFYFSISPRHMYSVDK